MSYDIQLFSAETKSKEEQSNNENFFDDEKSLQPFTGEQFQRLKSRLTKYGYTATNNNPDQLEYRHSKYSITALLTHTGLYFSASC